MQWAVMYTLALQNYNSFLNYKMYLCIAKNGK